MSIITIRNLTKTYRNSGEELHILKEINFDIEAPGIFLIKGKSGSGKSTLLNIIGGLDKPTNGEVFVHNTNPAVLDDEQLSAYRNKLIGFVFQFHFLLKDFTALENVCIPGYIHGSSKKTVNEKAERLLELVGLNDRIRHLPGELSGGERQRVALARALINDPVCILADEPTGNLDEKTTGEMLELLFGVTTELKKTLIMVTHETMLQEEGTLLILENGSIKR